MLILLPALFFLLVFFLIYDRQKDIRKTVLFSVLIWGTLLTVITEILSAFHSFNMLGIALAWLALDLIAIALCIQNRLTSNLNRFNFISLKKLGTKPRLLLIQLMGILLTVVGIGVVALVAAPNHSDSMEYHLSRVVHWLQNSSVYHYPTHDIFQLYQNPWSEFAIAHFQALSRSDIFSASVQYFSMLGCLIGASLIAKELGAKIPGQIAASVFCVTLPMGILQASSTNNDYVVSLWLTIFSYLALLTVQHGINRFYLLGLGTSLGLAILTKGTAYIYAFPFCLWLIVWGIKKYKWGVWQPVSTIGIVTVAINSGHYLRNFSVFGSPLGSPGKEMIQSLKPTFFISNILKQLSLHSDIIRYLKIDAIVPPLIGKVNRAIEIVHGLIGVDLNEPILMSPKFKNFYVPSISLNEDSAGNPLHLLLIVIAILLVIFNQKITKRSLNFTYALTLLGGFLLFCVLLTWSPARCRLHLPLFILYSGFFGSILAASFNRKIVAFISVLLLALSSPWVINNATRPMIGGANIFNTPRSEQYFKTQPQLLSLYRESAEEVASLDCQNLGLNFTNTSFEYPFWMLISDQDKNIKIQHVNVENVSANQTADRAENMRSPCAVIYFSVDHTQEPLSDTFRLENRDLYRQAWRKIDDSNDKQSAVQVFVPR